MIKTAVELLDGKAPLLALAIHNGHEMYPGLSQNCGIQESDRLREEDPFTETFACAFPNRIIVETSRFTIDLNRPPEKAVYLVPEDCWGLTPRLTPLDESQIKSLMEDYHTWYALLDSIISRLLVNHSILLILDLHSYNHRRLGESAEPEPQIKNPDIILGRNNMPAAFYPLVDALQEQINSQSAHYPALDCRIDVKFTGGWLSRYLHGRFPAQVICISVEFKKTFMDEWTGALNLKRISELSIRFTEAVQKTLPLIKNVSPSAQTD